MAALTNPTGAITVNVGGTVYMTTLATLTRVEGSMLGALAEALSDDEVLFIDRDGPSFRYVLNYLRDPFAKPLLPILWIARQEDVDIARTTVREGSKHGSACDDQVWDAPKLG